MIMPNIQAFLLSTPTAATTTGTARAFAATTRSPALHAGGAHSASRRFCAASAPRRFTPPPMMQASAQDLMDPERWTETGVSALQRLPAIAKRLGQQTAEAEHVALAFLEEGGDKGMAS